MVTVSQKIAENKAYMAQSITPILEPLVKQLLIQRPDDVHSFILEYLESGGQQSGTRSDTGNQATLKNTPGGGYDESQEDSEEDPDELEEFSTEYIKRNVSQTGRGSISAEVFGQFNKKEDFKARVIVKTAEQTKTITERLGEAFMFAALDEKEKKIVVDAMEIKNIKAGTWIIRQGEDGDLLYVIHEGTLECFKKRKDEEEKMVKIYNPGESFGELALLYSAPRAASIQAKTDSVLFALDRATFNNIVKDAEMRRRERYEEFLDTVEILKDMDPYDRVMLTEVFKSHSYDEGDVIHEVEDDIDCFYLIEDGAVKRSDPNTNHEDIIEQGGHFGHAEILKGHPSMLKYEAASDCELLSLSKDHFHRLLTAVIPKFEL